MNTEEIDRESYMAVLADLEARRDKINAAIDAMKAILASIGVSDSGISRVRSPQDLRSDTFFGLSIIDAARKYLGMVKTAQSVSQIWEALKQGGLPETKYNAVYNALFRREKAVGDVVSLPDKSWGLAEWYPSNPAAKRQAKPANAKPQDNGAAKQSPPPAPAETPKASQPSGGMTMLDHCEAFIREANRPLHVTVLISKLGEKGFTPPSRDSLSSNMRKEKKQRFKNVGNNTWGLSEWPDSILYQGRKEGKLPL